MKAVLVRPSNPTGSAYLRRFGFLPTPLSLLQLAGGLRSRGDTVRVFDMEADPIPSVDAAARAVVATEPELVGITLHATAAHVTASALARTIHSLMPDTVLVAGGHHATFVPQELVRGGFDVVALGEGDRTIVELVEAIERRRSFEDVTGIVFRDGTRVRRTPPRKLIANLDSLPMAAFDLVPSERYRIEVFGNGHVACIETARGCPYTCDFCSVPPTWGNRFRHKSNERTLAELEAALALGYEWIFFTDDIFLVRDNIEQRRALFRQIRERGLHFRFIAQMRADLTVQHPEAIAEASSAGLRLAFVGLESASPEVLREMHKGLQPADSIGAVRTLREAGVIVLGGIMLGAPCEDLRGMIRSVRFARLLGKEGADAVQFSIYTPLPGTRIFDQALRQDRLLTLDWSRYDVLTPVMRSQVNPALTQLVQCWATYSFFFTKWLRSKLLGVKPMEDRDALAHRAEQFFVHHIGDYLKDVMCLPWDLAKTHRLSRSYRPGYASTLREELLQSSGSIVYAPEEHRNPYFLIGSASARRP